MPGSNIHLEVWGPSVPLRGPLNCTLTVWWETLSLSISPRSARQFLYFVFRDSIGDTFDKCTPLCNKDSHLSVVRRDCLALSRALLHLSPPIPKFLQASLVTKVLILKWRPVFSGSMAALPFASVNCYLVIRSHINTQSQSFQTLVAWTKAIYSAQRL